MEIKLSERERTLIKLKAQDLTDSEIARVMTSNRQDVWKWFSALYKKIGCKKSPGMIYWACQNGVLEINLQNLPIEERKVG